MLMLQVLSALQGYLVICLCKYSTVSVRRLGADRGQLRLINPAIMRPHLFGLQDSKPCDPLLSRLPWKSLIRQVPFRLDLNERRN